jgi:carboxyl-terminal processing protease
VVTLAALSGALISGGWFLQRGLEGSDQGLNRARLLDQVMARVATEYVDTIGQDRLYRMAINGMLQSLRDPYSVFLTPERLSRLDESTSGNYGGLGIQIDAREGFITVIAPIPGTPAERAGIQTGDRIIAIDGRTTEGYLRRTRSRRCAARAARA